MSQETTTKVETDAIQWAGKGSISAQGATFEVGHMGSEGTTEASRVNADTKKAFSIVVDWPVGSPDTWVETSEEVKNTTGIQRYKLYDQSKVLVPPARPSPWQYILCFTTTRTFDYHFSDGGGDTEDCYECNVFVTAWDHCVQYNATHPNITRITGTP